MPRASELFVDILAIARWHFEASLHSILQRLNTNCVTDCLLLLPFANYVTARGLLKEGPKKNFSKEIIPKLVIFIFLSNKGFEIFHSVQHMFSNSGIKALCMQQKIFKLKIYGKFVRGVVWLKLQDITKITSPSFNISRGNLFLAYLRFITIWHYFSNAMQFMPLAKME